MNPFHLIIIPHKMRWVQGRAVRRSKNTPAAPNAVHPAGNSSTQAVNKIWFKMHSPFTSVYVRRSKKVQNARFRPHLRKACSEEIYKVITSWQRFFSSIPRHGDILTKSV